MVSSPIPLRRQLAIACAAVAVAVAAACGGTSGKNAPAFGACSTTDDCQPGLECLCGVCGKACQQDPDPGGGTRVTCSDPHRTCIWLPSGDCGPSAAPAVCTEPCSAPSFSCARGETCLSNSLDPDPGARACQPSGCNTDYGRFTASAAPPVSLRSDVMPIFGLSCVAGTCHDQSRKAGLYLGPRCKYDSPTELCVFPPVEDPNPTGTLTPPAPLTEAIVEEVRALLLAPSATAPEVLRVKAGAPDESFLLDAMAGTANNHGYVCSNQYPEWSALPCGDPMLPYRGPPCNSERSAQAFDTVARWIAEGAADN